MSEKRKQFLKKLLPYLGLLIAAVLVWQFVAVGLPDDDTGGSCFSVVFDKAFVKGADRIVIYEGEEVITITDKAQVRQIADAFIVANCTDLCGYYSDLRMEIYNGSSLVREVRWNDHGYELARIYDADIAHWVFPSSEKYGQVSLSDETQELISEIIEQHRQ